jgi:two-component system chemotaxis sensor kinase CheA
MTIVDAEIRAELLVECLESLKELDDSLLELEDSAGELSLVASAFRAIHSIKGAVGFIDAPGVVRIAHHTENLLSAIRDGDIQPTSVHFSLLFKSTDAIREQLQALTLGGENPHADVDVDIALCEQLITILRTTYLAEAPDTGDVLASPKPATSSPVLRAPTAQSIAVNKSAPEAQRAEAVSLPVKATAKNNAAKNSTSRQATAETTVRVQVTLLDNIMTQVGELVVCRNQILRVADDSIQADLQASIQRLDHLTSAIQERVMKTRMRPVGVAWGRLPRLVRDLAQSCGKTCTLTMEGQEVELDRSILEHIKDPLAHMIRNAVDHGLEENADRITLGKPEVGRIHLKAAHVGGQIHIELSDDGRGLSTEEIRIKAVEKGIISAQDAEWKSAEEIHNLVFEPGFTTASQVTDLSGRGVGMDVVKSTLTRVGGTADISSTEGCGSTVRLKIPLSLAILPALIIRSRGRTFAIPQSNLIELVDLVCGDNYTVEDLAGTPVLRRRGELLPLINLDEALGLTNGPEPVHEFVIIVQADNMTCGFVVDHVEETEEIVAKPLGPELHSLASFSGATVRGDGSIALILDVLKLSHAATSSINLPPSSPEKDDNVELTTLLRFSISGVGVGAVDVAKVLRIDDVQITDLQKHNGKWFRVHNERILPILDLIGLHEDNPDPVSLVICQTDTGLVAVAVSEVIEVVDAALDITPGVGTFWSSGMAYICGTSTSVLDMQRITQA